MKCTDEFISKYFHKGSMIAINGSIQQRGYTDKSGGKRYIFEILVDSVNFCGEKNTQSAAAPTDTGGANFEEMSMSDDDLPF